MADRAKYIQIAVANGVTNLRSIRDTVNRYDEGGSTRQEEGSDVGSYLDLGKAVISNAPDIIRNPKDYTYAIMVGERGNTGGMDRSPGEIAYSINNKDAILDRRGTVPRDLASLYIYGNDLGQFKEAPELRNIGFNYDDYLRRIGRNPDDVITYEGIINSDPVYLPEFLRPAVQEYIDGRYNKAVGASTEGEEGWDEEYRSDDVAGYLQTLDRVNGVDSIVSSDLWDFKPGDYWRQYDKEGTNPLLYLKAAALDAVGNPFILKDSKPVVYKKDDDFFDSYTWGVNPINDEFLHNLGLLPEVETHY